MEILYPSLHLSNSIWLSQSTEWTGEENKKFERALAIFGEHDPERWLKVAAMIPGKTVVDVIRQYKELEEDVSDIEAGRFPIPGYFSSSFTMDLVDDGCNFNVNRKRPLIARSADQERKKGVPWTEAEHRRFLMGLLKYGRGDWRNISRNFVVSKTPIQVASHAQKYFIRQQISGVKEKRRPSIHDITTFNLADGTTLSDAENPPTPDQTNLLSLQQNDWNHSKEESFVVFDSTHGNLFMPSRYEIASNGLKLEGQNQYTAAHHGAPINPHNLVFQISST